VEYFQRQYSKIGWEFHGANLIVTALKKGGGFPGLCQSQGGERRTFNSDDTSGSHAVFIVVFFQWGEKVGKGCSPWQNGVVQSH